MNSELKPLERGTVRQGARRSQVRKRELAYKPPYQRIGTTAPISWVPSAPTGSRNRTPLGKAGDCLGRAPRRSALPPRQSFRGPAQQSPWQVRQIAAHSLLSDAWSWAVALGSATRLTSPVGADHAGDCCHDNCRQDYGSRKRLKTKDHTLSCAPEYGSLDLLFIHRRD